jgi:hypothetical protein
MRPSPAEQDGLRKRIGVWDASAGWRSSTLVGNHGPSWSTTPACDQVVHMPPPPVAVSPANAEEWPVVERLVQLQRHNLSQFRGYVLRADGTYPF